MRSGDVIPIGIGLGFCASRKEIRTHTEYRNMAKQTNRGGGNAAKHSSRKKSESKSVNEKIINAALEEIYASVEAEQKKAPKQKNKGNAAPEVTEKPAVPKKSTRQTNKKTDKTAKPEKVEKVEAAPAPAPEKPASERKTHVRTGRRKNEKTAGTAQSVFSEGLIKRNPDAKLRVIPLGGLNEVGKNMTVFECEDEILIVDCGIGFPDEDMPGIDLVIPDMSYLETNRDKIKGLVLTHGHEDHIGAVPYFLRTFNVPVWGTKLSLGILKNKLEEFKLPWQADLRCVQAGDTVTLGKSFAVEFIRVNHSIADACALAISTPVGLVVHSGDFKLDLTPIEGDRKSVV